MAESSSASLKISTICLERLCLTLKPSCKIFGPRRLLRVKIVIVNSDENLARGYFPDIRKYHELLRHLLSSFAVTLETDPWFTQSKCPRVPPPHPTPPCPARKLQQPALRRPSQRRQNSQNYLSAFKNSLNICQSNRQTLCRLLPAELASIERLNEKYVRACVCVFVRLCIIPTAALPSAVICSEEALNRSTVADSHAV